MAVHEAWPMVRLKSCFSNVIDQAPVSENGNRGLALESVESWTGRVGEAVPLDGMVKRFREKDVLFGKLRPYLAKVARPAHDGVCVGEFLVLRPREARIDPAFAEYVLRSKPVIAAVNASAYGARMPRAEWDSIGTMRISVPGLDEQAAIARFLDHADRRIRRAIRAKQKLIALLNEQKKAVIHRAVTRGLDTNVRLKPSGVDWLGDVPEHWEITPLKRIGSVQIGLTYSPNDIANETGMLVLRASNIRDGRVVDADNVYVSKDIPPRLRVREDDILVCVRSGSRNLVGKSALITSEMEGVSYGAFMSLLRTSDNSFVYWVLNSNLLPSVMARFETSTINQLTQNDLKNLVIPFPPGGERTRISDFLTRVTSKIDAAIAMASEGVSLLHEFRTRLIADAVTGKLDVRTADPEPATA